MSTYDSLADDAGFQKQRELIEKLGFKEPVIFDVGANIGQSIEKYRTIAPGCSIFSFEPNPDTFKMLKRKYGSEEKTVCIQLALGAETKTAPFYATKCPEASSLLPPEEFVSKRSPSGNYNYNLVSVPVDTLDHVARKLNISKIDILKMDVQGGELGVLQGGESLLNRAAIDFIFSEVLFAENYAGQSDFNDLCNHLKRFGYVVWDVIPFLHTKLGRLWTANAIFVSPDVMKKIDPR